MNQVSSKIKSFTDLNTWKEGHKLVIEIYRVTKNFPKEEVFGLTSQMRRCAVSITSNLAEGFSRRTIKEKQQFYSTSLGSTTELQNQLLIARDIKYLPKNTFQKLAKLSITVHKLTNGLLKSSLNKPLQNA
jgi:four helix bundle protein